MGTATAGIEERAPQVREFGPSVLLLGPATVRALRQQAFLLTGFAISFLMTVAITFDLVVGGSLLFIAVGLPLLVCGFIVIRTVSTFERRRIGRATGVKMVSPYRELPTGGPLTRLHAYVSDPATWRDASYMVVSSTFGVAFTFVILLQWMLLVGSLALPFLHGYLQNHNMLGLRDLAFDGGHLFNAGQPGSLGLLGVILLATGVFVSVWLLSAPLLELMTRVQFALGNGLLGLSRTELTRREAALRVSRGQAVSAAETERRRIERDLHDGAQQRLVALAMDLGMAKAKLGDGEATPDEHAAAAKLVAAAHEGVKLALSELRDLARGIHPAVLTDRGLDAALSALAARSPVPIEVDAALTWRPSPEIESAAYFVASEALANMAKHSHASRAWIDLEQRRGALCMTVGDDGVGGADVHSGTGLSGLSDRIAPLDGILSVSSPIGGPTLIVMEIPCKPPLGS